jgi:hypothetical protein
MYCVVLLCRTDYICFNVVEGDGAAINFHIENRNVNIHNCSFTSNGVEGNGMGGAVNFFFSNFAITITGCSFSDNYVALGNGGAMHFESGNTDVRILSCVFSRNTAARGSGGGMFFHSQNVVGNLKDLVFVDNLCGSNGGALGILTENYNMKVLSCIFRNNTANGSGALYTCFIMIFASLNFAGLDLLHVLPGPMRLSSFLFADKCDTCLCCTDALLH